MASKMYILILDSVDLGHAILAAAHASLSGYLLFTEYEQRFKGVTPTQSWVTNSFRKVVCKVSQTEFDKAKTYFKEGSEFRIMNECGLPGNPEVALVFAPREEWPPFFKSLKLYK